ncbi:unnamed protein product [Durusdinium trenchii]|uniref:Peptidylprolyl isomerase n=1 Tax=Durusdinium trenchii TaxID=1381693 RepID=A0ABP0R3T3_9DINO
MRGQELSAMAWAFGTWSALDAALMALVISRARDIDLSCQDVANLYWGFGKLLAGDGLTAMEAAALPKISRFNTQELSSIAQASATQLSCDSQLVSAIAEEAARRGEGGEIFGPQSLPCARAGPWVGGPGSSSFFAGGRRRWRSVGPGAAGVPVPSDPDDVTRWEVGKGGVTDLSPNVPGRLLLRSPEVPKEATAPADGAEVTFNIEVFDLSARTRGPAALSCQSLRAQLGSGEVRLPEELEWGSPDGPWICGSQ